MNTRKIPIKAMIASMKMTVCISVATAMFVDVALETPVFCVVVVALEVPVFCVVGGVAMTVLVPSISTVLV